MYKSIITVVFLLISICSVSTAEELPMKKQNSLNDWKHEKECIRYITDYLTHLDLVSPAFSEIFKTFISSGRYSACEIREIISEITKK